MTTAPRELIRKIDTAIDAIRSDLRRRERIDINSAESWQRAWDRHPDLRGKERDLFAQRGIAQIERDNPTKRKR